MITTLYLHQLAEHLKSLRLQVSLIVVVGLFAASGGIYVYKYLRLADLAPIVQRDIERRYEVDDLNELLDSRLRLLNERRAAGSCARPVRRRTAATVDRLRRSSGTGSSARSSAGRTTTGRRS